MAKMNYAEKLDRLTCANFFGSARRFLVTRSPRVSTPDLETCGVTMLQ
jgi:hypothetical protein